MESVKVINPVFSELVDHIALEHTVYREKGDIYNELITGLVDSSAKFSKQDFNSIVERVQSRVASSNELSNVKEIYLLRLCSEYAHISNSKLSSLASPSVLEILERSRVSASAKGLIGYVINSFSETIGQKEKRYLSYLQTKLNDALVKNELELALDYGFGLETQSKESVSSLTKLMAVGADSLTIERLSKAIIFLSINHGEYLTFINKLEEKVRVAFGDWKRPDIEFSLVEAHKLVNSNIPEEHLRVILKELKKASASWTKWIEDFESEGVVVNLKQFARIPNFSPNDDVWSHIALKIGNRDVTYQVSEQRYVQLQELIRDDRGGYRKYKTTSIIAIIVTSVIYTLAIAFMFSRFGNNLGTVFSSQIFVGNTLQEKWTNILPIIYDPIIVTLFNYLWLVFLTRRLWKSGRLRLIDFLQTFPIVFIIKSIFDSAIKLIKKELYE